MPEELIEAAQISNKKKDEKDPRKKNDIIFKGAFEDYFVHLLRFTYPNADQIFDFNKEIIFLNHELAEINIDPGLSGGTTRTDLLAKVFLMDGTVQCFYLHIEIQAVSNVTFPERVFDYYIRLRDKYGPSVVSLAVFTGKKINCAQIAINPASLEQNSVSNLKLIRSLTIQKTNCWQWIIRLLWW